MTDDKFCILLYKLKNKGGKLVKTENQGATPLELDKFVESESVTPARNQTWVSMLVSFWHSTSLTSHNCLNGSQCITFISYIHGISLDIEFITFNVESILVFL